jgi:NAD(P)-dependent dehydrogenase (short-subunit alcohol dehydrogenase family)
MSHNKKYRTALITGAAKRIGRAVALSLAADEMNLILHYNSSESEIADLADEVMEMGRSVWAFKADLADPNQAESLFTRARQESGSAVEVLINNASIFPANG